MYVSGFPHTATRGVCIANCLWDFEIFCIFQDNDTLSSNCSMGLDVAIRGMFTCISKWTSKMYSGR